MFREFRGTREEKIVKLYALLELDNKVAHQMRVNPDSFKLKMLHSGVFHGIMSIARDIMVNPQTLAKPPHEMESQIKAQEKLLYTEIKNKTEKVFGRFQQMGRARVNEKSKQTGSQNRPKRRK